MSDKPLPSFRSIAAPLDADDAALDRVNASLGVPKLTKADLSENPKLFHFKSEVVSAKADAARSAAPSARAPAEKLTIEIPAYLGDAIRRAAVVDRKTARHVVMEALKEAGFKVEDVDLVPDGRRTRART